MLTTIVQQDPSEEIFSSGIGAILYVIVAALVGSLSDEKQLALEKEMHFKLDTAHYFFNPLCIAEGNLDLALTSGHRIASTSLLPIRIEVLRENCFSRTI